MVNTFSKETLLSLVPYMAAFVPYMTPVTAQASGTGTTTRYWDCCKPSCGWSGKTTLATGATPVLSCDINDSPLTDFDAVNACDGDGTAYMCSDESPWAVSEDLAYGYAAVNIEGGDESSWCCACYELTFTSGAVEGKKMIVQATNTGADLGSNQFDISIPGGGVGIYNGCTNEWGAPSTGWGAQYGGISDRSACDDFPDALKAGCYFRFDWFSGADNPTVSFEQVTCPAALTAKTGCIRADDSISESPTGATVVSTYDATTWATSSATGVSSAAASSSAVVSSAAVSSIAAVSSSAAASSVAAASSASAVVSSVAVQTNFATSESVAAISSIAVSTPAVTSSSVTATSTDDADDCEDETTTSTAATATETDSGDDCEDEGTTTTAPASTSTSSGDEGDDCDDETTTAAAAVATSTSSGDDDCEDETTSSVLPTATATATSTGDEGDDCEDETTSSVLPTSTVSGDDDDCEDETTTTAAALATATDDCSDGVVTVSVTLDVTTVTAAGGLDVQTATVVSDVTSTVVEEVSVTVYAQ